MKRPHRDRVDLREEAGSMDHRRDAAPHLDPPDLRVLQPTELRPRWCDLTRLPLSARAAAGTADRIISGYGLSSMDRRQAEDFNLFHVVDPVTRIW
jgi:hypothetical protein